MEEVSPVHPNFSPDISSQAKTVSWSGKLPTFGPVREGGPGTLPVLIVFHAIGAFLVLYGIYLIDTKGIGSAGPALVFFGILLLGTLILWVIIKGILRDNAVTFIVNDKGVKIVPSAGQRALDKKMKRLSHIVFLYTWKGGQWSLWEPFTRWKDMRRVLVNNQTREIVLSGGAWDIRLVCPPDIFQTVVALVEEHIPKRTKIITED
ncbi:MAG: hypothetical protein D5R96_03340 [Methanocalculus sp. MSAO_Arc2]|nr:MAG: hypothetical protein D5R96_03340 [Methanocalculus sp. MSAO_Arc2]